MTSEAIAEINRWELIKQGTSVKEVLPSMSSITRFIWKPTLWFRKKNDYFLDAKNTDSISWAADDLAEGKVIIMNMCSDVLGFVIDATNDEAIDKVASLKGRDRMKNPLVVGASEATRLRLVESKRLPLKNKKNLLNADNFDLPHFLELPIHQGVLPEGVGMNNEDHGRVAAMFWANFDNKLILLEAAFQAMKKNGVIGGSSANFHGEPPLESAQKANEIFQGKLVSRILYDRDLERNGLPGSHAILGLNKDGLVTVYRGGSISAESYFQIYRNMILPEDYKDPKGSIYVDLQVMRIMRSYDRISELARLSNLARVA